MSEYDTRIAEYRQSIARKREAGLGDEADALEAELSDVLASGCFADGVREVLTIEQAGCPGGPDQGRGAGCGDALVPAGR
jgi:hypothetical protein